MSELYNIIDFILILVQAFLGLIVITVALMLTAGAVLDGIFPGDDR